MDWKIKGSESAAQVVFNTYFFAKASPWKYEQEWRDINQHYGSEKSPLHRISSIYFGMSCPYSVKVCLVKLFSDSREIKFYKVVADDVVFKLKKVPVDTEEIHACGVNTYSQPEMRDLFKEIQALETLRLSPTPHLIPRPSPIPTTMSKNTNLH